MTKVKDKTSFKVAQLANYFTGAAQESSLGFDLSLFVALKGEWNQAYLIANKYCVDSLDQALWQLYCLFRAELFAEAIILANKYNWGAHYAYLVDDLRLRAHNHLKMGIE